MPDYTPDEMHQRELYEAQREEKRKSLATSLRNKHTKHVKSISLEELSARIDATQYVLEISKVSYRKTNLRNFSYSRKRSYLVRLLTTAELNARANSLD